MRLSCLMLSALLCATAQAQAPKEDTYLNPPLSEAELKALHGRVDPVAQQAVKELVAAEPAPAATPVQAAVIGLNPAKRDIMTAAFDEAQVPDCLHSEGLRRQPTFFLKGVLALPFIPIAYLRGVCN